MNLTSKLILHLDDDRLSPTIPAVQNDTARFVEVVLYADGRPWDIPSDAAISVRYRRQDGAGNAYSTLPDGSPAGIIKGDTVLVALAKEALAVSGITTMQITVELGKEVLSTFAFQVQVQADPSAGAPDPGVPPQNEGGTVNVQPLTFTGAVKATYDGTKPVEVNIPSGGNDYSLPVATSETLGGVMPVTQTEDMTQPVGVGDDGRLYTAPSAGSGSEGGGASIFTYSVTAEQDVDGFTVTLPVKLANFYILNFRIATEAGIAASMALYCKQGNTNYKNLGTLSAGTKSANLLGIRGSDAFFLSLSKSTQATNKAAPQLLADGTAQHLSTTDKKSFTLYSSTDGVTFPANTTFEVWGVYKQ